MRSWLIEIRKNKQMNQFAVAEAADITESFYSLIESNKRRPSPEVAQKIGATLGFDWTRFFENDNPDEAKAV